MSIARHHAEWLSLVPVSGPFLSLPVLMEAFNTGLEPHDPDQSRLLRQEYGNWQESFEKRKADPAPHQHWIKFVLTKTLELDGVLAEGQAISQTLQAEVPEHHELLRPSIVLIDPNTQKPRLLVQVYPRSQELTSYVVNSRWKASPDTRMTELLHATGVRLGLVTNGEHWMLVDAPKGETTGYASWYASLWLEEPITLRAFRGLLSASRFFNVPDDQTLEALLTKSASNQQEVTDQLGYQVRRAVEVLIHEIAKIEHEPEIDASLRKLISEIPETVLYESGLTVMMRLVFLFCAEERELIPTKPFPVYEQNYSVSTISKQLRELADQHDEALLERRYDAWPRLLSAFRAVYGGLQHDDVHIPAYGGSLFNPDRFPFLEGRNRGTSWRETEASPLPVSNRTVLHLLEALQLLQIKMPGGGKAEARRLSFRALDIEQIGHVYEGLLDHTAKRASEPFLGLAGTRDKEPEFPLAELEKLLAKGEADLVKFLKEETGKSENAVKKSLKIELDPQDVSRFRTVCQGDEPLWKRVQPFAGLVRLDNFGYPVVIPKGTVFVTAGTDRRSSGTHYTPRSLTEPIVQYTLEPLVYIGPAEGLPKSEWKLKSAAELLALKICDMACGSGAFLVQAARYMAERLLEAWDEAKQANPGTPGITPDGEPSTGKANEALIPDDPAERKTYAMRIIAQRCLYGVDINPLAAEMAKLSLWLLTLAKDKPFEFLDHSIRCGDSLVGLNDIAQLRHFSLKPDADDAVLFKGPLDEAVNEAITLRLKLEDLPANSVEDVERQEKLLKEANEKIARLRCAADLLVAAEFWGESAKDKMEKVRHAAVVSGHYIDNGPTEEFEDKAAKERRGQKMFHWPLEFPEVIVKRGGFDAFMGNPPFLGGSRISGVLGDCYLDYILSTTSRSNGNADLCSFFLRRAMLLCSHHGYAAIIATNSIYQSATRDNGLRTLLQDSCIVYRARRSVRWPGTANVYISFVFVGRGQWDGPSVLDGEHVQSISSSLEGHSESTAAYRLIHNLKTVFRGPTCGGDGFILTPQERNSLITQNPNSAFVIKPFVTGQDINQHPEHLSNRFAIDLGEMEEHEARKYDACWDHLYNTVRLERIGNKIERRVEYWWRYHGQQKKLYESIAGQSSILASAQTSKYWGATWIKGEQVFAGKVVVFALTGDYNFALLNSFAHTEWAEHTSSRLKEDPSYNLTGTFETFPRPSCFLDADRQGSRGTQAVLKASQIGHQYFEHRKSIMGRSGEGLTSTYNRFHDPKESSADIQKLRELHVEMDQAVAAAYGWNDLELGHDFHNTKQVVRFSISEPARRGVLQRLLKINHERYVEEEKQGLHGKVKTSKSPTDAKPKKAGSQQAASTPTLFDLDDDEASFPSNETDTFLCGLVCDLVAGEPGLQPNDCLDELVVALGIQRHKRLLSGKERTRIAALCKAIPSASGKKAQAIPWSNLQSVLSLRQAVILDPNSRLQVGPEFHAVRTSYPACDPEMVDLIRKAAAELRDLLTQAEPSTPEKDAVIQDFKVDRQQLCGVPS